MIDRELYIARRLYRGETAPSLTTSNAQSALDVARSIAGPDFAKFGLLADLTSFVQHGDILAIGTHRARLEIIEVKEGPVNETILEFLSTLPEGAAEAAFQSFRSLEGEKTYEQQRRVVRQKERGAAISQLPTNERGVDPNLDIEVRIGSTPFAVELYDNRLSAIIDRSVERGWAIDVIDDCLFLAAYRGVMRTGAERIFSPWFQSSKPSRESPIIDLASSLTTPLALPPFARFIRRDQALDLVFGRCRVMLGLNVPAFVELIRNCGAIVRPATKKERAMFSRGRAGLLISDGQAIIVELGDAKIALNDGYLLRMLYDGVSPKSAAEMCALPPEAPNPSA